MEATSKARQVLQVDSQPSDQSRLLFLVTRSSQGDVPKAGADLREDALIVGLRRILPTDVLAITDLHERLGCIDGCSQLTNQFCRIPGSDETHQWPYCASADIALGKFLEETSYAAVIVSHVPMHHFIRTVRRYVCTRVIVDLHNAEADLEEEMFNHPDYVALRAPDAAQWSGMARVERVLQANADLVTIPSASDRTRLIRRYGNTSIAVVPNCVDVSGEFPNVEELTVRSCFFLGALEYFPNTQAGVNIAERIGPAILHAMPWLQVIVAGRRPPSVLTAACGASPVPLVPDVVDVSALFRNSILLVPLECGGGTRLKILQAFASGCPVISTSKGMEGIDAQPGIHYVLADDSDSFVDGVRKIVDQPADDLIRRKNAWALVCARYSWDSVVEPLRAALVTVGVPAI